MALIEEADRDGVGLADDKEEEELRIRISPPRIKAAMRLENLRLPLWFRFLVPAKSTLVCRE